MHAWCTVCWAQFLYVDQRGSVPSATCPMRSLVCWFLCAQPQQGSGLGRQGGKGTPRRPWGALPCRRHLAGGPAHGTGSLGALGLARIRLTPRVPWCPGSCVQLLLQPLPSFDCIQS